MTRPVSRTARVIAPLLLIVITLALAEIALRSWFYLFPPLNHTLLSPYKTGLHLFEPSDGNVFYRVKPGYRQVLQRYEFKVDIQINNIGLREERDYLGEAVDIAFVGDSFTFGWGVEQGERYSDVVARTFPGLNVLSYSYPNGHAPVNYLAFLQQNPELMPEVLVLGLFAFNDLADDTADAIVQSEDGDIRGIESRALKVDGEGFIVSKNHQAPVLFSPGWFGLHTAIGRAVKVAAGQLRNWGKTLPRADKLRPMDLGQWDETALQALEHVRRLDRMARQAGSVLLVFYIPFPSHVGETPVCIYTQELCAGQRSGNMLGEALSEWAAEQNIRFIDPVGYFRVLESQGEELYYPYDAHWTPRGHAAAGKMIADYLKMYGLVKDG